MRPWEARFGLELDWEKLWRDQVFGAKVRPWEACFGPELDWEKLWRDQVFGVKMDRDKWTQTSFFSRDSELCVREPRWFGGLSFGPRH